jgi:hypothetical protein
MKYTEATVRVPLEVTSGHEDLPLSVHKPFHCLNHLVSEVTYLSETSGCLRTTRRHKPQYRDLHSPPSATPIQRGTENLSNDDVTICVMTQPQR